jgi:hypothetical protein
VRPWIGSRRSGRSCYGEDDGVQKLRCFLLYIMMPTALMDLKVRVLGPFSWCHLTWLITAGESARSGGKLLKDVDRGTTANKPL